MRQTVRPPRALRGSVVPPGDKSVSHRAAILNAIAAGAAEIENFQRGADCLATLRCLRQLGVEWRWSGESTLRLQGRGLRGLQEPSAPLNCANSGTTLRLLSGLLAAQPFFSVLTGDASLRSRPMGRIVAPLREMGARVEGREGGTKGPLAVRGGQLRGIRHRLPVASAQVKSALLLAGLYAEGDTVVEEPSPTRDHTERLLAAMGARVEWGEGPARVSQQRDELSAVSLRVPGDISAAAPWLVLAALHPDAEVRIAAVGVNPTRTGVLDALRAMGTEVRLEEERRWGPEPVADIVVRSSRLRGTVIGGELVPRAIDELPLLALAGCLAEGETLIRDATELRAKESDRVKTTAAGLRRLGAAVEEREDGLRVWGPQQLRGAAVSSHGDHRLAVMLAVAGCLAKGETEIRNAGVVAVSYPLFWRDLDALAGR
ncbi:MAG TPA: 3-phosphoshikimate 1-carboxyvinyltransferase [Dehalococcoidia bacterium]|nr:3-phosphoshikimate 1-carboxyvinyltransferase [Dehalococcoidia bacterium]